MKFSLKEISKHIADLTRIIGTSALTSRLDFRPDWGHYLWQTGQAATDEGIKYLHTYSRLEFDYVGRVNDDLYTLQSVLGNGGSMEFMGIFDFAPSLLNEFFENLQPSNLVSEIIPFLKGQPYRWHEQGAKTGFIGVIAEVADDPEINEDEVYFPLKVTKFLPPWPWPK